MENEEMYLFIDIDDLLVRSSPLIQKQVEAKTNFKTSTLKMLEQLKRNCQYLVDQVTLECKIKKEQKKLPDFSTFPILKDYFQKQKISSFDDINTYNEIIVYEEPINIVKYYLQVANKLFEQFLETRDMFLEVDNLPFGESKKYSVVDEVANLNYFIQLIYNNKYDLRDISEYALKEVKKISSLAKEARSSYPNYLPEYGSLVKMDTNDVIKNKSSESEKEEGTNYLLLEKPVETLEGCFKNIDSMTDIIGNYSEIIFHKSKEDINYASIYKMENTNSDAIEAIKNLLNTGWFSKAFTLSHHNGGREEKCKRKITKEIFSDIQMGVEFIGQFFHQFKHNVLRRGRSSKIDNAMHLCGLKPHQMVLIDDSVDNCMDWYKKGGIAILYKPMTDAEKMTSTIQEFPFARIMSFDSDELINVVSAYYKKGIQKVLK